MAGEVVLAVDDSPTILKVVQLVLSKAGYQVDTAANGEEGLAAARAKTPDLILLDFVMPRMNGYEMCRELAADPKLRDVPVILMSAKGDQIGDRFVKVMGLVDYITKPFSPEAITAVVSHTIGKYSGSAFQEQTPSMVPGEDLSVTEDAERAIVRSAALNEFRRQVSEVVAGQVSSLFALAAASTDAEANVPTDAGAIADAAKTALQDEALLKMFGSIDLGLFAELMPALRGDIRVIPIADVLQMFGDQEQSGVLSIERSTARVDIYFRNGRVDQALATGVPEEFLFGRFAVQSEVMTRDDLDRFIASCIGSKAPSQELLGRELVKQGHMTESELRSCLAQQTSEIIYEVLRWRHGRFRFNAGQEPTTPVSEAGLSLDVAAVLMDGYRRVDEWHLVERAIDNFDQVFLRNEDTVAHMGRGRLTREELAVLDLVNGKNTVKDIVRMSRLGSFDVAKLLYRLLSIKLVRRRVQPVVVH